MKDRNETKDGPTDQLKTSGNQPDREARFFEDISLSAPIGTFIVQDGKFQFVNPYFQKITGYGKDELLDMESLGIVHPADRDMVRENAVKMLKEQRSSPYEHRVITKEGKTRWIIEMVAPIKYHGKPATLGNFMDITERERARESFHVSEATFYKAFRAGPDWVVISTIEDGFYIDVNDAFLRSTGYRREEVIGRTAGELDIWVDPDDRAEMVKMLREQGSVRNMEVRFRMKSEEIRFVLWSAEVIDFGGEKCLIAAAHDITERRQAEEKRLERVKQKGPATLITQLGLTMAGSILLCFAIGYYLDKWLNTKGLFITVFILLGVIGGGYNAYRQIMETIKLGEKNEGQDQQDQ